MTIKTIRLTITVDITNEFFENERLLEGQLGGLCHAIHEKLEYKGIIGELSVKQRVVAEMQPRGG